MKCTLFIYHNETNDIKDRKLVNKIEEIGETAYKRLATLLINSKNDKRNNMIWTIINQRGLHAFNGVSHTGQGYEYHYFFEGDELEMLPTID